MTKVEQIRICSNKFTDTVHWLFGSRNPRRVFPLPCTQRLNAFSLFAEIVHSGEIALHANVAHNSSAVGRRCSSSPSRGSGNMML